MYRQGGFQGGDDLHLGNSPAMGEEDKKGGLEMGV